jgi:hypothetical protein
MARYETTIESTLPPEEAFAYMADFTNAQRWDPSVRKAELVPGGNSAPSFDLVARFAGRNIELRYLTIGSESPRKVVLEAKASSFVSRDTIVVTPGAAGSLVHYDARLIFSGPRRILEPIMQVLFRRLGENAKAGLERELNPR